MLPRVIHTFDLGPRTLQLLQCDKLPLNLRILVHQNCGSVLLRVTLNAHIGANLTELDITELGSQLPPKLGQHARFDVAAH